MTGRIRVAVLSAGGWSRSTHLPTLLARDDVDLVAVTSPDLARARAIAEEFGAQRYGGSWADVKDVDPHAVVVSSPPIAHEEQVIQALRHGCHVLVEKPFALTAASADRMLQAAVAADRALLVGLGWNRTPIIERARAVIAEDLGDVECCRIDLTVNIRNLLVPYADQAATYADPATSGGGAAAVSMSHQLGMLLHLTGSDVVDLAAMTHPSGSRLDLHDAVVVRMAGGAIGSLTCTTGHRSGEPPRWRVQVQGDRGELELDTATGTLTVATPERGTTVEQHDRWAEYTAGAPTDALVDVAKGGDVPPGLDAALSARVVALTERIYAAANR